MNRSTDGPQAPLPVMIALGTGDVPDAALKLAVDLARREGRGLRLAHVMPPRRGTAAQEWPLLDFGAIELLSEQVVEAAAERARLMTDSPIAVERVCVSGSVTKVLVELSTTASHVILTRRKLSPLRRVFTGSTSTHVAAHVDVPVVSVPEFWTPWQHDRAHLTVGVRGEGNRELLSYALREAGARNCELDIVLAWTLPVFDEETWMIREEADAWEAEVRTRVQHELDEAAQPGTRVPAQVRIVRGRPVDVLVDASRTAEAVLVGRTGHRGHLGTLARALIRESHSPVEVVPLASGVAGADGVAHQAATLG